MLLIGGCVVLAAAEDGGESRPRAVKFSRTLAAFEPAGLAAEVTGVGGVASAGRGAATVFNSDWAVTSCERVCS